MIAVVATERCYYRLILERVSQRSSRRPASPALGVAKEACVVGCRDSASGGSSTLGSHQARHTEADGSGCRAGLPPGCTARRRAGRQVVLSRRLVGVALPSVARPIAVGRQSDINRSGSARANVVKRCEGSGSRRTTAMTTGVGLLDRYTREQRRLIRRDKPAALLQKAFKTHHNAGFRFLTCPAPPPAPTRQVGTPRERGHSSRPLSRISRAIEDDPRKRRYGKHGVGRNSANARCTVSCPSISRITASGGTVAKNA
jgi:hypothetical protein